MVRRLPPSEPRPLLLREMDRIDLGEVAQHVVEIDDGSTLKVLELNPRANGTPGEVVHVAFDPEDVVILED